MDTGIILGIIGIFLAIAVPLAAFIYRRRKLLNSIYDVKWRSTTKLKPKEVMGERGSPKTGFRDYYSSRPEDERILAKIESRENVLIVGPPLAGKTRAAYQAFKRLNKPHDVIIPRCDDIILDTFLVPRNWKFWRPRIVFLDDIHKFVEKNGFERLLRAFLDSDTIIVATCRSGIEYKKIEAKIGGGDIDPALIFGGSGIELKTIAEEEGKRIADAVNIPWADVKFNFNGTVGSIFLPLREMEIRFDQCEREEKTILRAIKQLFDSGIYKAKQFFPHDWIKIVCKKKYGLEGEEYDWKNWRERLKEKEFVKLEADGLWVEEVYLEGIVKLETKQTKLKVLEEMRSVFSDVPEAIFLLGNKAWDIGTVELEKAEFMKMAIEAYEEALKVYTRDRYPMQYGTTQNNLGNTYKTLAEVEAKAENSKRAIEAHEKAMEVYTRDRYPMQYGTTQNNLGNAYSTLAEVEAKAENSKRAIEAYEKALEVYTRDRYPMDYGMTQNNLGNAYSTLAEVEAKAENCKRAIEAYEEALKIYTRDRSPMQYGTTQNNLGNAYPTLAEVEAKAENCKRAIEACEKALKVYTRNRFPMDYGMTQNNLGNAYQTLAEVESKAENCKRAIEAYEKALEVRTRDRFPMDYGMTQNNLGAAYKTLAGVEAKAENCKRAIEAYEEALEVRTRDRYPMDYGMTQNNLGNAYQTLAEVEAKAENSKRAIEAYEKALEVRTRDRYPMQYGTTQNNLGAAYKTLAEVEAKAENSKRAIEAHEEALKVRTRDRFPMQYGLTQNNLGIAYRTLAEVEAKAENSRRAIEAYEEALKIYSEREYPEICPLVEENLKIVRDFCEGE
jgi:tetratricopeptide (TPR) repeat protein